MLGSVKSQVISSVLLTIIIYTLTGNYSRFISGTYLTSHDTQKVEYLMKNPEKLKEMMLKKIKKDPEDKMAWKILAISLHKLGQNEKAIEAIKKAQEVEQEKR